MQTMVMHMCCVQSNLDTRSMSRAVTRLSVETQQLLQGCQKRLLPVHKRISCYCLLTLLAASALTRPSRLLTMLVSKRERSLVARMLGSSGLL